MADYKYEEPINVPRFNEENGFYTTKQRSKLMAKIKAKHTIPEVLLRKALWKAGIRYRIHNKKLPGKPDIVVNKYKLIIFVDGEFWHGRDWAQKNQRIKANRDFWIPKIERNMQRDQSNNQKLEAMGFKVFRFWDNDIKKGLDAAVQTIIGYIKPLKDARRDVESWGGAI